MSYAGLRPGGANAVLVRPSDKEPVVAGDTWFRDGTTGVPGTEADATFLNRVKAVIEAAITAIGGDLNAGDAQLANAIVAALALKANVSDVVTIANVVDDLTTNDAQRPLSAAQGVALKALIHGLGDTRVVEDLTDAATLDDLSNDDVVHVLDNGAGKWARYQVAAAGDGTWDDATKVLLWTQDQAPASHGHAVADLTDASADARSLLQAADYAAIRVLLSLGSAALLTAGTEANNAVQLDGDGKLPAVDGSQLTNLAGGVPTAREIATAGLASGGGDLTEDRTITVTKASNGDAIAGTDDTTAMTPLRTKEAIEQFAVFTKSFESSPQTITTAGALTLAHGLGAAPKLVEFLLENVTAEAGYTTGQRVVINPGGAGWLEGGAGLGVRIDATNIVVRYGSNNPPCYVAHATTGVRTAITNANWTLIVRGYA